MAGGGDDGREIGMHRDRQHCAGFLLADGQHAVLDVLAADANHVCPWRRPHRLNSSGSLAIFAAIRRASSIETALAPIERHKVKALTKGLPLM
jgi:hypothetical protein